LLAKGYDITILDLEKFDYADVMNKVNHIQGDIRINDDLNKALENVDLIVHCAAALPLYPEEVIMSTDYKGTENVLKHAHKKGINRLVHISTTAVYGIPDHHPLFETDKMVGVGPYGEAKILAEKVCGNFRKKGMVVPILRPKSFVGPERLGVFAIYCQWIREKKNVPIVGMGKNRYQLLDVEDLCEAIYMCLTKNETVVNDTYNIGAREFTTMKEDFGAVIKYAKTGKRVIGFPAKPLILLLRILEAFKLSPLYKWVYETAPEDSFVSVEKAENKLGFKSKYSNKDALIRTYQWYLENYKVYENRTGVSHRVPWKQGILKFVKLFF
jgi:nucleoside-diphosphate-sugar epimerase